MDFIYKKTGSIFNMHSYWTKQPVDAIEYFINRFSKKWDTVLDPFAGTGMTGVAAIKTQRNAILSDISPACLNIAKGYCTNFETNKRLFEINSTKETILKDLNKYYQTKCTHCGETARIKFCILGEIWQSKDKKREENRGEAILNNKGYDSFNKDYIFKEFRLLKVCYDCGCSKIKQYKTPNNHDIELFKTNEYREYFYPKDNLFGQEPRRNYKRGIKQVYQLYSPRNLSILSIISHRINQISDRGLKQLFQFIFTSILFNSSLMSRYREYENTSIKMGTFYIPPLIKDSNVVENFINKFEIISKGNAEIFSNNVNSKITFIKESADKLSSIKANQIDYIYTDPPYSDVISYSELNIVYESWLKDTTDTKKEMIVSKYQDKNIEYYATQFENFLKRSRHVLKNHGYLTLIFHHPDLTHWSHLQKAIVNSKLEPVLSAKPIRLVSRSKTSSQHKTQKNTQCFLVFNFQKNNSYKELVLGKLTDKHYIELLRKIKEDAAKEGYNNKSDCFDYLINYLLFRYEIKDIIL